MNLRSDERQEIHAVHRPRVECLRSRISLTYRQRVTAWLSRLSGPCHSTPYNRGSTDYDPGSRARYLPEVNEQALERMKFSEYLPSALAVHVLGIRAHDPMAVEHARTGSRFSWCLVERSRWATSVGWVLNA